MRSVKLCSQCGELLSIDSFSRDRSVAGGRKAACRECVKPYQRDYDLRRHYGISAEEYDRLYDLQFGSCASCWDPIPRGGRNAVVEHRHESGYVRGIVCSSCNKIIGFAKEDIGKLHCVIDYLRRKAFEEEVMA